MVKTTSANAGGVEIPRKEVVAIVDKNEYRKLMDFIKLTDPKAFVTVYAVNEMQYQPKK